jgi:hypothetical protein
MSEPPIHSWWATRRCAVMSAAFGETSSSRLPTKAALYALPARLASMDEADLSL